MFEIKPFRKLANLISMACLTILLLAAIFTGWRTVFINASSASTIDFSEEGKTDGNKREEITPESGTQSVQQKFGENSNSKPTDQAAKPKPQTREDFEKKFWQWASSYFEPKSNSGSDNPTYLPIILAIMIALFAIVFASHSAFERYSTGHKLNLPLCVLFCISTLGLFNMLITVNLDQDLYKSALSAANEKLSGLLNDINTHQNHSSAKNAPNPNNDCETQSCVIEKIKSLKKDDNKENSKFFDVWIDEIKQHATKGACGKVCRDVYEEKRTVFKDLPFQIDGTWKKNAPDINDANNWAKEKKNEYHNVHKDMCTVDAANLTETEFNIARKFSLRLEKKINEINCQDFNKMIKEAEEKIGISSDEKRMDNVIKEIDITIKSNDQFKLIIITPEAFRKQINKSRNVYEQGAILVNRNISENVNKQDRPSNKLSSSEIDAAEMTGNLANPVTMLPFLYDTILSWNGKIILITLLSLAIAVSFDWFYVGGISHLLSLYFKPVNNSASQINTPNILKISSTRDNPGRGM